MSTISAAQLAANRTNAQGSTGPRTAEGKQTASQNSRQHGLTGTRFVVLGWEVQEDYDQLLSDLRAEHKPATPTEQQLVDSLAQHRWLSIRAGTLQEYCFSDDDPTRCAEVRLALYLRYQTHHERAFHKCLDMLLKLRRENLREHNGFVSQTVRIANGHRNDDRHFLQLELLKVKLEKAKQSLKVTDEPLTSPAYPVTSSCVAIPQSANH